LGTVSRPLVSDITDEQSVPVVVAALATDIGPIDLLMANAGYGHEGTFEESTMADLHRQFDVNGFGSIVAMEARTARDAGAGTSINRPTIKPVRSKAQLPVPV